MFVFMLVGWFFVNCKILIFLFLNIYFVDKNKLLICSCFFDDCVNFLSIWYIYFNGIWRFWCGSNSNYYEF